MNITKASEKFLKETGATITSIKDSGIHSGVRIELSNGMAGVGYQRSFKPLRLNVQSFTYNK